jgi:hypothetical protein
MLPATIEGIRHNGLLSKEVFCREKIVSDQQIVFASRQAETGARVKEVWRKREI